MTRRGSVCAWCVAVSALFVGLAVSSARQAEDADPFAAIRSSGGAGGGRALEIRGVEVAPGVRVDLELERFEVLAPDAAVVVADSDGQYEMLRPEVALFRGRVAGEEDSRVFVASTARGVEGFIQTREALRFITTGGDGAWRIADSRDLGPGDELFCAMEGLAGWPEPAMLGTGGEGPVAPPCRVVKVALETDWEFAAKFGGDTQDAAAYAVTLLGAVSEIYRRDLNVRLSVPFLRVWADDSDPYGAGALYPQLSGHWNANMAHVERHTVHMLSGRLDQLLAGEASIASICVTDDAYGVSTKLTGSFPYPLAEQSGGNWDVFVVAHELGHNFGSVHTHEYDPPIDGCGLGECADADEGTIMSYCQVCAGGVANIRLEFHPRVVETMLAYLDGVPCALESFGAAALDDQAYAVETLPVVIDVLLNDETESCEAITIESFDAVSGEGGSVELVDAGSFGRARLRYTSALGGGGADSFSYGVTGGARATVHIDVEPLRPPDLTGAIAPGVGASYFVLTSTPAAMPNYAAMSPYLTGVATQLNYASSNAPFAGSGRLNLVGAVFEGFIEVPTPGIYTIFVSSDDGSRLWLGDDLLVDNDGVHTMLERSGVVGLAPGKHVVRVEFFEGSGAAGLIVSWQGPGIAKQPIPAPRWFRRIPCPGDRNLDAMVDVDDLNLVLGQWGMTVPPTTGGDETGDGLVNVNDLNVILSHWNAACP